MADLRRVVITGIGAVTPIGIGVEGLWTGLQEGKSAVRTITRFDPTPFRTRIAAQVDDFHATDHIEERKARRIDRVRAVQRGGDPDGAGGRSARPRAGKTGTASASMMGTALGGVGMAETPARAVRRGRRSARVDPALALMVFAGAASCNVAIEFGVSGPNSTNGMSCASGTIAIGDGVPGHRRGATRTSCSPAGRRRRWRRSASGRSPSSARCPPATTTRAPPAGPSTPSATAS